MYSWGSDTSDWKSPDYKFDSARSPYLGKLADDSKKEGPRSYTAPNKPNMGLVDPSGKEISTESKNPIIVGIDVTGSMRTWPAAIFDRLPLLYQTLSQYREDVELCLSAIGDATYDDYPLQINNFGKGLDLEKHIKALYPEGGGGGQLSESYELFAHFMLEYAKMPNATSPFLFIFGDEKFYNKVDPAQVEHYLGRKLTDNVESADVLKRLTQRFNLYFLQKPYGYGDENSTTKEVYNHWANAIGGQRIIKLVSEDRAVDQLMGIVAKSWGQYGDFDKSMAARQDEEVRKSVYNSIRHVPDGASTYSTLNNSASTSLSKMYKDAKR